jgi:hypothetical protein
MPFEERGVNNLAFHELLGTISVMEHAYRNVAQINPPDLRRIPANNCYNLVYLMVLRVKVLF